MKTLVLVRHAKSDKDIPNITDFERPLNARGDKDARKMAKLFAEKSIKPDYILSSPSVRTYATMKYFAEELGFPIENVVTDETIYYGNSFQLTRKIQKLDNSCNCVMVVGHNPDITVLAGRLTGKNIDNVPTCGVVCIDFNVNSWEDADDDKGKIRFFEYPRKQE